MQEDGETAHVIIQSQLISAHTSGGKTEEALATCRLGWRRILHMQLKSQTKTKTKIKLHRRSECDDTRGTMQAKGCVFYLWRNVLASILDTRLI